MSLTFGIYFFGWILYSNKEPMKLLKEFEFWYKLFYLSVYLVAEAIIVYIRGDPLYLISTIFIFQATILFLVTIFDATNINISNKTIISSFALAIFSDSALLYSNISILSQ